MTHASEENDTSTAVAIADKGLLAQFAQMVTLIPSEDGSGAENILRQILTASSWDQLDSPWESTNAEDLAGRHLVLRSATRRPSDFRDGLGMFLVLHCTDPTSGEAVTVTTGSVSILGQVVRAYALKALPLLIEFVIAERPTEAGYKPHHLKIHASGATQQASNVSDTSA